MTYLLAILMICVLLYGWLRGHWFFGVLMGLVFAAIAGLYGNTHGMEYTLVVPSFASGLLPWLWIRVWRKPQDQRFY